MNKFLIGGAGAAAGIGIAGAAAAAYVARAVQGRATGDLQGLIDSNATPDSDVAVFLGASIVKGRASVDFVDIVRTELPDLTVINAGENGETVHDVRERLDATISVNPAFAVILIGSNDAQIALDPSGAPASRQAKQYGGTPTVASYRDDLAWIVTELQEKCATQVALCTLPPLGQDLQSEPNRVIREFNAVIEQVASAMGAILLDVYAGMAAILTEAGVANTKPFTGKWQPGRRSLTQHFIVGRSYDDIAEREGLLLSPDYVHLNTAGAQVVADLAIGFLQARMSEHARVPDQPTLAESPEPTTPEQHEQTDSTVVASPPSQRTESEASQPARSESTNSKESDDVSETAGESTQEAVSRTMGDALREADAATPYGQ